MPKTIGIIGGDLRIIRLAEILAKEKYLIYTYGIEKYKFSDGNIGVSEEGVITLPLYMASFL